MGYFRLRDIKTPPFAYVLNMEQVIQVCRRCQIPFREPGSRLEIAICETGDRDTGKPIMADHWLVGDDIFADKLEELFPDQFKKEPVLVVSSLHKEPDRDPVMAIERDPDRAFFFFLPITQIDLEPRFRERFPPMRCDTCQRDFPEIPIDCQPIPDERGPGPSSATLEGFYLEGYNYLFHDRVFGLLTDHFPGMILEKLTDRETEM